MLLSPEVCLDPSLPAEQRAVADTPPLLEVRGPSIKRGSCKLYACSTWRCHAGAATVPCSTVCCCMPAALARCVMPLDVSAHDNVRCIVSTCRAAYCSSGATCSHRLVTAWGNAAQTRTKPNASQTQRQVIHPSATLWNIFHSQNRPAPLCCTTGGVAGGRHPGLPAAPGRLRAHRGTRRALAGGRAPGAGRAGGWIQPLARRGTGADGGASGRGGRAAVGRNPPVAAHRQVTYNNLASRVKKVECLEGRSCWRLHGSFSRRLWPANRPAVMIPEH